VKNPFRGARYANVTATLALVVALGGTSYAVGTIGTQDLKPNAVTSPKIKNGQVKAPDLKVGAVRSPQVKDDTLTGADIADIQVQNIPLVNGWSAYDGRGARYGKDASGVVHLSGGVKQAGAFNPVITTLPPGFRPTGGYAWISTNLFGGAGPARLYISPAGVVSVQPTAPATSAQAQNFTSLDGVSFVP
jgi:hypothetical protein